MRFLIDAQLPPAVAAWIRQHGHEAHAVRELGLRDAEDSEIWAHAAETSAVVVTKDEDFALLAAIDPSAAVLWVRVGNTSNAYLLAHFEEHWDEILRHLSAGDRIVELR